MQLRFDHGPLGPDTGFASPRGMIRADTADQVADAFEAMDRARAQGAWLAGYISYELGYALEPRLVACMPGGRRLPLLCLGLYDGPQTLPQAAPSGGITDLAPRWSEPRYTRAFDRVKQAIGAGDVYQANLTFPVDLRVAGDSAALYAALAARQPVGHGVFVSQPGLPDILCRSPELFFRTDAAGHIETRPMKGTQPRSDDPAEDDRRRAWLARDEKNRAENLMIVDLLRNDISRVAEPGSVHAPELFHVETYATVHQMVSRVAATLRPDVTLSEILRALFPCGSITGAPKIRAMEILADLEPWPRDIYCGSIGWAAPDGRSEFNVAIRTLLVEQDSATLNLGGGVVWDSTARSEYEEALWKARFVRQMSLSFA
ncbi:aminodeoxychorismate synthase component I [Ruegeria marina]|uniref:Aminodeoxychorismate synthase, subunit I n=1 Tax=Ruegeria marina TaxID=639004 RepID=A0A1G6RSB6_9RHOB|nr:aminodeoxychorismate synthase component I [Ruegeria marina]SDD07264.1 aminodeoxychorismate synthase, subunit I [Ruegeria marina]